MVPGICCRGAGRVVRVPHAIVRRRRGACGPFFFRTFRISIDGSGSFSVRCKHGAHRSTCGRARRGGVRRGGRESCRTQSRRAARGHTTVSWDVRTASSAFSDPRTHRLTRLIGSTSQRAPGMKLQTGAPSTEGNWASSGTAPSRATPASGGGSAGSPFRRCDTRTVLGSFLPPRWCEEAHRTEYWTHCMHSRTLHPDGTLCVRL